MEHVFVLGLLSQFIAGLDTGITENTFGFVDDGQFMLGNPGSLTRSTMSIHDTGHAFAQEVQPVQRFLVTKIEFGMVK